MFLLFHCFV
jgi:Ca2+-binding EF-hand superfamily protein